MHVDLELEQKISNCADPVKLSKWAQEQPLAARAFAANPSADEILLRRLCTDGDKYVRLLVAKHAHCDEHTLKILARDREVIVREASRLNLILKRLG